MNSEEWQWLPFSRTGECIAKHALKHFQLLQHFPIPAESRSLAMPVILLLDSDPKYLFKINGSGWKRCGSAGRQKGKLAKLLRSKFLLLENLIIHAHSLGSETLNSSAGSCRWCLQDWLTFPFKNSLTVSLSIQWHEVNKLTHNDITAHGFFQTVCMRSTNNYTVCLETGNSFWKLLSSIRGSQQYFCVSKAENTLSDKG